MGTHFNTNEEALAKRSWVLLDAQGEVLGRLASKIASILRGKTKPDFAPHNDCGDFVLVINADKIRVTGGKENKEFRYRHTGYTGGIKRERLAERLLEKPEDVIRLAVKGMLPHTTLGRAQLKKLKIYRGSEHPHSAQQPQSVSL